MAVNLVARPRVSHHLMHDDHRHQVADQDRVASLTADLAIVSPAVDQAAGQAVDPTAVLEVGLGQTEMEAGQELPKAEAVEDQRLITDKVVPAARRIQRHYAEMSIYQN